MTKAKAEYSTPVSESVFKFKEVYPGRYQVLRQEKSECPTSAMGYVYLTTAIGQIEKEWVEKKQSHCWFEIGDKTINGRYNVPYETRLTAAYGIVKNKLKNKRWESAF